MYEAAIGFQRALICAAVLLLELLESLLEDTAVVAEVDELLVCLS